MQCLGVEPELLECLRRWTLARLGYLGEPQVELEHRHISLFGSDPAFGQSEPDNLQLFGGRPDLLRRLRDLVPSLRHRQGFVGDLLDHPDRDLGSLRDCDHPGDRNADPDTDRAEGLGIDRHKLADLVGALIELPPEDAYILG